MKKIFLNSIKGYLTEEGIFSSSNASILGIAIEAFWDSSLIRKGKELSIYLQIEDNTYTSVRIIPMTIERISDNCLKIIDSKNVVYYLRRFT